MGPYQEVKLEQLERAKLNMAFGGPELGDKLRREPQGEKTVRDVIAALRRDDKLRREAETRAREYEKMSPPREYVEFYENMVRVDYGRTLPDVGYDGAPRAIPATQPPKPEPDLDKLSRKRGRKRLISFED